MSFAQRARNLIETIKPSSTDPATEHDFIMAYDKPTDRLNAVWPRERVNIRGLPNITLSPCE
jgi:hypothetical protein